MKLYIRLKFIYVFHALYINIGGAGIRVQIEFMGRVTPEQRECGA